MTRPSRTPTHTVKHRTLFLRRDLCGPVLGPLLYRMEHAPGVDAITLSVRDHCTGRTGGSAQTSTLSSLDKPSFVCIFSHSFPSFCLTHSSRSRFFLSEMQRLSMQPYSYFWELLVALDCTWNIYICLFDKSCHSLQVMRGLWWHERKLITLRPHVQCYR